MKFLCDRCKTRYTIADDRVRGKVLKIRCKNCANVITVREGGEDAGDAVPQPAVGGGSGAQPLPESGRIRRPTASNTGRLVPAIARTATSTAPPPGTRPTPEPAAPPPPVDDEWYVSVDGNQTGPLTLAQAQAWVAGRPGTEDLFCWNEGFDDWLPTEKVSHFRGLRTRRGTRPPTLPPPVPADAAAREPAKPLFAETMARLEADAPRKHPRGQTPPPLPPGAPGRPATPAPAAATPAEPPRAADAARASDAARPTKASTPPPQLFDAGGDDDDDGTPPPTDAASLRPTQAAAEPAPSAAADDDLSIGEVSRVVRIADLAKGAMRGPSAAAAPVAAPATRRTMSTPAAGVPLAARSAGSGATSAPAKAPGVAYVGTVPPPMGEEGDRAAPARRGAAMLVVLGLVLAGIIGAIVFVVIRQRGEEGPPIAVGGAEYDDLGRRIDGPAGRGGSGSGSAGSGSAGRRPVGPGPRPVNGNPAGSGSAGSAAVATPTGDGTALTGTDVEDMSRRMTAGTQRCWMNAQKKDPFLDVKSIRVTLTVAPNGAVTAVSLSEFSDHFLGQCLKTAIGRWPFRASPLGITARITLAFQAS